ncbi:hypothetical protein Dvina_30330 [Dactylosporangium vinaceum]|uniref:Secreted protein n=1 Tax=Dactylosporangium vinaceum TaxID=53362 RepID=A0ABV5MJQ4_9ACTN|nr:hypothetical protein [Dactylosporangium vinaceum]UAB92627.1 hypothetical protein Dvina_30330 [Dactylosporangium vinaceum]
MKRLQILLQLFGAGAMLAQREGLALAAAGLAMLLDIPRSGGVSARARLPLKVVGARDHVDHLDHLGRPRPVGPEVEPIGE